MFISPPPGPRLPIHPRPLYPPRYFTRESCANPQLSRGDCLIIFHCSFLIPLRGINSSRADIKLHRAILRLCSLTRRNATRKMKTKRRISDTPCVSDAYEYLSRYSRGCQRPRNGPRRRRKIRPVSAGACRTHAVIDQR